MRSRLLSTTVLAGMLACASASQAADDNGFSTVTTSVYEVISGISADGSTVFGLDGNTGEVVTWSDGALTRLRLINGANPSAINADGHVIVGSAIDDLTGNEFAFRLVTENGSSRFENLGTVNGGSYAAARGVSADGKVVVGYSEDGVGTFIFRGFRWLEDTRSGAGGTLDALETLVGGNNSYAEAVSADGKVVAGSSDDGGIFKFATRWDENGNIKKLGTLQNSRWSEAKAISADGNVIVGDTGLTNNTKHVFRWVGTGNDLTDQGIMSDLGALAGGTLAEATAVSADGKVIVGNANDAASVDRAFRWSDATHMITVDQWLTDAGVTLGGVSMKTAAGTNRDGSIVVGKLASGEGYLARVVSSGNSGVMTMENFQDSLAQAPGAEAGLHSGEISINGGHGKPMRNLLDAGRSALWTGGDLARVLESDGDAVHGFGEIGYGYGLSDGLTARVAVGGFGQHYEPTTGGAADSRLAYVLPELSWNASGKLYLTASGYYGTGTVDNKRGYLNGAALDYSSGSADLTVAGGRIRADLKDLWTLDGTALTPFASYTLMNSKRGAYTETGGAFPVAWNSQSETSHVMRAGLDATHALTPSVTLLGHLEGSYGLQKTMNAATGAGTIVGLSSFGGQEVALKQWGAQAGIGMEMAVGKGTASLMFNAATGANNPTGWVAASYKVEF